MLGRETALDKITWTQDGWPMVNNLQGPSVLAKKPELPEFMVKEPEVEFGASAVEAQNAGAGNTALPGLGMQWVTVREPEENFAEVREDGVHLLGSRADLCEVSARNLLLQRQTAFNFIAETRLSFAPLKDGQDAGMTCYYDENTYLKFGVFAEGGKTYLKVQEHVDRETWDSFAVELESGVGDVVAAKEIVLRCETKGLERSFSYNLCDAVTGNVSVDAGDFTFLGILPNVYYLCDEGIKRGKRFTGAMIGVYAHGDGVRVPIRCFSLKSK